LLDNASSDEEEDDLPLQSSSGMNPSSGIVFYFQLTETIKDDVKLVMNIFNDQNKLIRSYSSVSDSTFVSFPGGPPAAALLPKKKGINRFVWDMRYPILPGVPNVFIEGSYLGHKAPPGNYRAVLQIGEQKIETSFRILPDPRLSNSMKEYEEQDAFLQELETNFSDIHHSILKMRKVKNQLKLLTPLLGEKQELADLKEKAEKLTKKINEWEEELVQNKAQSNDDIINYINKLSADYIFLKGEADANIPYVTGSQREQLAALNLRWQKYKGMKEDILRTDLSDFNRLCKERGIGTLVLPMGL
jgi:hypothetical protein